LEISVVIVSYNSRQFLRLCLESVSISALRVTAAAEAETEIVVIDNNSTDGTSSMVTEGYPGVRFIGNISNRGFASACNQGIEAASGRFILILNPDTVLTPDTLTECILFMRERPEAGVLGVKLTDRNGVFLPESKRGIPYPAAAFFRMSKIYRLFPRSRSINRYYMGNIATEATAEVGAVTGAFMFMRREAVQAAGLFDERYFMYGEDLDLCLRISEAGYGIWYSGQTAVTHFKGQSGAMYTFRGVKEFFRSMNLFIAKNFTGRYNFLLRVVFHLGVIIAFALTIIFRTPSIIIRKLRF